MKKVSLLTGCFLVINTFAFSQEKGTSMCVSSGNTIKQTTFIAVNSPDVTTTVETKTQIPFIKEKKKSRSSYSNFNIHIPPGEAIILKYDSANSSIKQYAISYFVNLTDSAKLAIEKAPSWLKCDLRDVLAQISSQYQNKWAKCILEANDPYIDEIVFSIANLSPEYLQSPYAYPEMFTKNAEYIYKYDSLFKYVEIKNYGNSITGGDYYSTAVYKIQDSATGPVYDYEIPKDIYYWYVVHPELTDEIPGFIDPAVVGSNSNPAASLTTPAAGKFWREYIINHGDPLIPKDANVYAAGFVSEASYRGLSMHMLDTLANIDTSFYDNFPISGQATQYTRPHVIACIDRYILSTMFFTSLTERPHQPVRILKWGIGRCGEFEDLTLAVGRSSLIPSAGIEGISGDHVWNAFYFKGRWIPWEPVNGSVDCSLYATDTAKFASVSRVRSDEVLYDALSDYSNIYGTIRIKVTDKNNKPVDGAYVCLYVSNSDGNIYLDNARTSDCNGIAEFKVSESKHYYGQVYAFGTSVPAGNFVNNVVNSVVPFQTYNSTFKFTGNAIPEFKIIADNNPISENPNKKITFDLAVEDEYIFGRAFWSDLGSPQAREHRNTGVPVSFFEINEENFNKFNLYDYFDAYNLKSSITSFDTTIAMPAAGNAYFFIRNSDYNNFVNLNGNISFINNNDTTAVNIVSGDTSSLALLSITALPSSQSACENNSISFGVTALGAGIQYQWQENCGGSWANLLDNTTYSGAETSTLTIANTGLSLDGCNYQCILENEADTLTTPPVTLTVHTLPPVPTITQNGDTLTSSSATNNHWYLNGNPISGATSQTYNATASGSYQVKVTNSYGCSAISAAVNVTVGIEELYSAGYFGIYPNPTNGIINISMSKSNINADLSIFSLEGQIVYHKKLSGNSNLKQIDLSGYSKGIYFLKIVSEKYSCIEKLVIE